MELDAGGRGLCAANISSRISVLGWQVLQQPRPQPGGLWGWEIWLPWKCCRASPEAFPWLGLCVVSVGRLRRDASRSLPYPVQVSLLLRWILIPSNFAEGKLMFPEEAQAGSKTSKVFFLESLAGLG